MSASPESSASEIPDHLAEGPTPAPATEPEPSRRGAWLRFARMAGSSIAGRDAAPWVTDFLNAAYYRRDPADRRVDDLRLAFSVLTTFWYLKPDHAPLRLHDLRHFHRAFGAERFRRDTSVRGRLDRAQLEHGAATLLGGWFPEAYADPARRGWGITFPTVADREAYDPRLRLRLARLGELTPEQAPAEQQTWHTYPPVRMPSAEGVIAALTQPETWPDYASEIGRFTPLRPGGLAGQTFEIDVAAGTTSGRPLFTRGYVSITELVTPEDPAALARWFQRLEDGLAQYGKNESRAVPGGATPLVGFDLTTHEGHFMGAGHNRLLLYADADGVPWVRAAGTWDPMPWHIAQGYRLGGQEAQHAFWGQGEKVAHSMLHQLALQLA